MFPPAFESYLLDLERFFCLLRMSGFILSPKDSERVRQYYLKGIPLHVLLKGVVDGAQAFRYKASPGQKLPHNLSFYAHFIGAGVRRFRTAAPLGRVEPAAPAAAAGPTSEARARGWLDHLRNELDLLLLGEDRPLEREVKERAAAGLAELSARGPGGLSEPDLAAALRELDEQVLDLYHSRLNQGDREAVARQVEQRLAQDRPLSRKALEERRQAVRAVVLRARMNLLELAP
jgi:hypothetical protein